MLFFKKKKSDADNKQDKGINKTYGGVEYHDDLLEKLTEDHKKLFNHYIELLSAVKKRSQQKVLESIKNFRIDLKIHHQSEKKQLYSYLKDYYKMTDKESLIRKLDNSANNLYDNILHLFSAYANKKLSGEDFEKFQKELEELGEVLTQRIKQEEGELYTLYKST